MLDIDAALQNRILRNFIGDVNMVKWYINEFSKLTNVSRRALQYYDNIGLLKPTLRTDKGYRMYSEDDLHKLNKITVLKYFEFDLSTIKNIINNNYNIYSLFTQQLELLNKKHKALSQRTSILKDAINIHDINKEIPWEDIIKKINSQSVD